MYVEWNVHAFSITIEEGVLVEGEVGFAVGFFVGVWMKDKH